MTTDEMDSTTPAERAKLVAMCDSCGHWQFFTRGTHPTNTYDGIVCQVCTGTKFRELISQRTFDLDRAKKITAKWLKAHKK